MPIKPHFKTCVLAIAIALSPMYSLAAGLGRLNVLSSLGQPFKGEIDLISVQQAELESLTVKLATVDAYSAAQLAYPEPSLGLRLTLNKRSDNTYVIQVSSAGAVDEPVFNLLVDLSWLGGKVRREYTALLDPAGYKVPVLAAPAGSRTVNGLRSNVRSGPNLNSSATESSKIVTPLRTAKTGAASVPADIAKNDQSYLVKRGDTLTAIAKTIAPEGVSLEQVIVGLYQANPNAFSGNMNRLQQGHILRIPKSDDLEQVSRSEAIKEIKVQSAQWQHYRQQLSTAAAKMPAVDQGSGGQGGGRITAKVEDKSVAVSDAERDVLKLARGTGKAEDQVGRIKALEEEVSARKKALEDASQRVAELQKNIKKMEEMAALQSSTGASLQQKADGTNTLPDASASSPIVATASKVAAEIASTPIQAEKTAPKPKRVEPPVPPPEASIIDILIDNALPLGGGIAAVFLGVAGLVWSRNRRRPNVFENSLITSGDLKPNTVLGRTGGGVISTQAENSFLTDFSRQGLGTIDTDEVDPIAEADVYMAYGRDAQAEEILKDALIKDPARQEIRMKLLDIYVARKDKVAFEEVAADLYASVGGKGSLWEQASYMGRNLDPNNALYAKNEHAGDQGGDALFVNGAAAAMIVGVSADVAENEGPVASGNEADEGGESPLDFEFELPGDESNFDISAQDNHDVVDEESLVVGGGAQPDLDPEETLPDVDFVKLDEQVPNLPADVADSFLDRDDEKSLIELNLPIDLDADLASSDDVDLESLLMPDGEDNNVQFDPSSFELPDLDLDLGLVDEDPLPYVEEQEPQQVSNFVDMPSMFGNSEEVVIPASAEESVALEGDEFDLDFGFDTEIQKPASNVESAQVAEFPIDLELEIGDTAAQDMDFSSDDPVQTKIDLARAYIDMGDVEGAREILQEAEQEGNQAQQELAKSLLADL